MNLGCPDSATQGPLLFDLSGKGERGGQWIFILPLKVSSRTMVLSHRHKGRQAPLFVVSVVCAACKGGEWGESRFLPPRLQHFERARFSRRYMTIS